MNFALLGTGGSTLPSAITSLNPAAWYDFGGLSTLAKNTDGSSGAPTNGQLFKYCSDLSGKGNSITNAAGATWNTNVQNGLSAAAFDGTSNWLTNVSLSGFSGETGQTVMVTCALTGVGGLYGMLAVTSPSRRELRHLTTFNTPEWLINAGSGALDYAGALTVNTWHEVDAVWDGSSSSTLTVDGANPVTGSDSTSLATYPSSVIDVGSRGGTNFFQGNIGTVLIFPYALTTIQLAQARSYLKTRWGTP